MKLTKARINKILSSRNNQTRKKSIKSKKKSNTSTFRNKRYYNLKTVTLKHI